MSMSKSISVSDETYDRIMKVKQNDETIEELIQRMLRVEEKTDTALSKWLSSPYKGGEETDSVKEHDVVH